MADAQIRAVITAEDRASKVVAGFGSHLSNLGDVANNVVKRMAQVGLAAAGAVAILGVKTAADLESARMGFITLLGSAEKADKTLQRIKDEAKRTPFEVTGLTQATQMLTAVTKDGDKAIDIILDVGEGLAAMGRGQGELDRISVNLQQIAATGRAAMIDIKQFAFAGIPIFEMLQQQTGLAGEALDEFISNGGVSFDLLTQMFDKANDEGGRFFNAFKNQTGTFNQQWSNLKDTFALTAAEIVVQTGLFDFLKQAMQRLGEWVAANKEQIITFLKNLGDFLKVVATVGHAVVVSIQFVINILAKLMEWAMVVGGAVGTAIGTIEVTFSNLYRAGRNFILPIAHFFQAVIDKVRELANMINNSPVGRFLTTNPRLVGGLLDRLIPRQLGGSVTPNQPYLVGEKGPEMMVPRQSGTVVPNHELGGSTVNLNVNVGVYAGTPMERRKISEMFMKDLQDIASTKGQTVAQMLGA